MTDKEVIEQVFMLALDGNYKCDRKIHQLIISHIGKERCEELKKIHNGTHS